MRKGFVVIGIVVLAAVITMGIADWSVKQTFVVHYGLLRAEADEDASRLNIATSGNFANKPATAVRMQVTPGRTSAANAVQLIFCGGAAENKTFGWKLYAYRGINGPAELVAVGTGTLGSQAVVKYPHNAATATNKFWADTLVVTTDYWSTYVTASSGAGNSVARLSFDLLGYEWLYIEITDADGSTGAEAGDISVYYSYF